MKAFSKYFLVFFAFLVSFSFVYATSGGVGNNGFSIVTPMCRVFYIFAGPVGKILAMITLVSIGIAFFMAKVTWTTALTVVMGVAAIFGAPKLVRLMTGGDEGCITNNALVNEADI